MNTTFVTTSIPYVNAAPHVGFALELVQADALARFKRQRCRDVRFQTGTDDNSLKNVRAALDVGVSTAELVDSNAARFRALWPVLDVAPDDFLRTSRDSRHRRGAEALWRACQDAGDLYRQTYGGHYCVGCEEYYDQSDTPDLRCPEHGASLEWVEEENWFFRLSRYTGLLEKWLTSDRVRVRPESRRAEVLSFVRSGLRDISVSRSRERAHGWGIPVPGDADQVIYVWFDALANYISALDWPDSTPRYDRYWAQCPDRVHVIGKGILRFHAVYWPAILAAAGLPLPTELCVHGYLTVEGEKIGKSRGNTVDPVQVQQTFGTDALRYFLLRHVTWTGDGDFRVERIARAYESELAGQLGNLLNRSVRLIERYADGAVPPPDPARAPEASGELAQAAAELPDALAAHIDVFRGHEALAELWRFVARANRYVESSEPWTLARTAAGGTTPNERSAAAARLRTCLYDLAEALRLTALHLAPFLPHAATEIERQLGIPAGHSGDFLQRARWGELRSGTVVNPGPVLFPRLAA